MAERCFPAANTLAGDGTRVNTTPDPFLQGVEGKYGSSSGSSTNNRPTALQIEIYFSIVQRRVVTPNAFTSLNELEERILSFQAHYSQIAYPSAGHLHENIYLR